MFTNSENPDWSTNFKRFVIFVNREIIINMIYDVSFVNFTAISLLDSDSSWSWDFPNMTNTSISHTLILPYLFLAEMFSSLFFFPTWCHISPVRQTRRMYKTVVDVCGSGPQLQNVCVHGSFSFLRACIHVIPLQNKLHSGEQDA